MDATKFQISAFCIQFRMIHLGFQCSLLLLHIPFTDCLLLYHSAANVQIQTLHIFTFTVFYGSIIPFWLHEVLSAKNFTPSKTTVVENIQLIFHLFTDFFFRWFSSFPRIEVVHLVQLLLQLSAHFTPHLQQINCSTTEQHTQRTQNNICSTNKWFGIYFNLQTKYLN